MNRTIQIDNAIIPVGWEPVAYRVPLDTDDFVVSCGGVVESRGSCVPDGPRLIVQRTTDEITAADRGEIVLVANYEDGPFVQRTLVDVAGFDRDYPFVCEAIDYRQPHQCWRYGKRIVTQVR